MVVSVPLLLGFLVLSGLLSAVPGPSVLLETSRAITRGRRAAMWIVAGNACGGLVLLALVVTGLGALVATSAEAFTVLRLLGACYLACLGLAAVRRARSEGDPIATRPAGVVGRRALLRQGFLVGVANPKSIVSLMAVLPQFVDHSRGHVVLQLVVIGVAGALLQAAVETTWVLAASGLRSWFLSRPRRVRVLRAGGGVAMLGLAGRLVLDR